MDARDNVDEEYDEDEEDEEEAEDYNPPQSAALRSHGLLDSIARVDAALGHSAADRTPPLPARMGVPAAAPARQPEEPRRSFRDRPRGYGDTWAVQEVRSPEEPRRGFHDEPRGYEMREEPRAMREDPRGYREEPREERRGFRDEPREERRGAPREER